MVFGQQQDNLVEKVDIVNVQTSHMIRKNFDLYKKMIKEINMFLKYQLQILKVKNLSDLYLKKKDFLSANRIQTTNGTNNSASLDNISGAPPSQAIVYQKLACLLLDTINEAVQSTKDRKVRSSFKMVRGIENDTKDFADLYDMNEKEILGMGRFGMVFGGTMRRNGVRIAIKKIQMTQTSQKDRENIEQEAAYLFQLNHPGLLIFIEHEN